MRRKRPGAPNALLAASCDKPVQKATARSWGQGYRRAPLPVLRRIHRLPQERAPECHDLWRLLEIEIVQREGEASHRGVLEIHERGGLLRSVQRCRTDQFRSDQPTGSLYCEQTLDSHSI